MWAEVDSGWETKRDESKEEYRVRALESVNESDAMDVKSQYKKSKN